MVYLYHKDAGTPQLILSGEAHRYIFKVRRHRADESLYLRNLRDGTLYHYRIAQLDKRSASLLLQASRVVEVKAAKPLHIGWCIIDPKSIEKVLPSLNEMGVEKITFIYCKRSQKSFKPDFKRLEKILLNSSQQSGRSVMMQLDMAENLETFLVRYPESKMLHFSKTHLISTEETETIVIGCEGGFTPEERALFSEEKRVGFSTPLVLKSESAACAAAAKLLV